jgi:ABC-type Na+ efflux pump permease subunit
VAGRELRLSVRRAWFYRARWLTAGAFFGLLLWLGWAFDLHLRQRRVRDVFEAYSVFVFLYCLFAGAATTADCLSREKREGTLGLLFLTNLSSLEITAGKIAASSLTLLYSLVAIFPLLALPVLLGGITATDFWLSLLALLNSLWFALAAGFVASALCVRQFPAVALAIGLALFFGLAGLGLLELAASAGGRNEVTDLLSLFSPLHTLSLAWNSRFPNSRAEFWRSLACVNLSASLALVWVSWHVAGSWRDQPKNRWPLRGRRPTTPPPPRANRTAFRRRLLNINPFFWLASRQRVSAPVFLVLSVSLILVTLWGTAPFFAKLFPPGALKPVAGHVFAWLWTAVAMHLLTLYYAAAAAAQRLAEDRQTGALELVLATPVNERTIGRGLWLAYARRMFIPMVLATVVHAYFIWLGAYLLTLEPIERLPANTTPTELIWAALTHGPIRGQSVHWAYSLILQVLLLIWGLFAICWVTLGWLGRWLSLRLKRPGFAPLVALALVIVPPVIGFSVVCYCVAEFDLDFLPEQFFLPLMAWVAFGIGALHCLALSLWAGAHLRENFRSTVIHRDLPEARAARGRTNLRVGLRLGLGLAAVLMLAATAGYLLLARRNSQSRQQWAAFVRIQGDALKLARALPPPLSPGENLATSPAFQAVLRKKPQDESALALVQNTRRGPVGFQFGNMGSASISPAPWMTHQPLNLAEQVKIQGNPETITATNAATALLEYLGGLTTEFDALAAAARQATGFRPDDRAERAAVLQPSGQALNLLESLHRYFELRASARLAVGDSAGAATDTITALQLARLAGESFDAAAALRAQNMAGGAIQPLWEGLARHAWSDAQLIALESELQRLDLLASYTNNIRRVTLAYLELWDQFGHTPPGRPLVGATHYRSRDRWQPRGWWLDCAVALHAIAAEICTNMNPTNGLMRSFDHSQDIYQLPLDSDTQQLFQQPTWWGNNLTLVAAAQTAVNQARTACALERYRQAHGRWPDTLEALVPDYLPRLPADVMRGRPLSYHREGEQYSLRGVGPNLRDDYTQSWSDDWVWAFTTNKPSAVVR